MSDIDRARDFTNGLSDKAKRVILTQEQLTQAYKESDSQAMSKINKQLLQNLSLWANVTLEYYTYTQGAAIQKALNAIATFFVSQSFASMMSISLMIRRRDDLRVLCGDT
ncbi:hypothetical protein BCU36_025395 [Vibrio lentus]|uniref:hypothetical protein n=1 Tax=Vibrio lentus TaxID=136468 RepID=UPI0039A532AD